MKKYIIAFAVVLGLVLTASPAFAAEIDARKQYKLQFTQDYARAKEVFFINGRVFLVQETPKTNLEIETNKYWIISKIAELQKQILLQTY